MEDGLILDGVGDDLGDSSSGRSNSIKRTSGIKEKGGNRKASGFGNRKVTRVKVEGDEG
jgi:hypothetical protein